MTNQRQPNSIFEQILYGLSVVNDNIVSVSKDIAELRESIDLIKGIIQPSDIPASQTANESEPAIM